jgi:hypothetical protein
MKFALKTCHHRERRTNDAFEPAPRSQGFLPFRKGKFCNMAKRPVNKGLAMLQMSVSNRIFVSPQPEAFRMNSGQLFTFETPSSRCP